MTKDKKDCFIIMPITTPLEFVKDYQDDKEHFIHVLEHLFKPAIEKARFNPISPISKGSDIIQAEIIKHLAEADLVLCDMSILNPNVFYEFGIRTALDQPVALVIDDKTKKIPFDTSIINFHKYSSSLFPWEIEKEIDTLASHINDASKKAEGKNSLWKYFGVAQTGSFRPGESTDEDKINLILSEIHALKNEKKYMNEGYIETPVENFLLSPPLMNEKGESHAYIIKDEKGDTIVAHVTDSPPKELNVILLKDEKGEFHSYIIKDEKGKTIGVHLLDSPLKEGDDVTLKDENGKPLFIGIVGGSGRPVKGILATSLKNEKEHKRKK
jgi:hypothetical protein